LELNCRKLIGSKNDGNTFSFDELIKNIKAGILLTVGNLSSVVLTSMDRWFVKALMTTLAFAQYSFAVSMENFMNVAVTPVTTTLYNYFCKATDEVKVRKARNYVMIFAALIVSCAFPARFILEVYLTKYIDSAKVMFLLFAAQIFILS
jgi:O-antigen/teichoic acid export membrane protein